MRPLEEVQVRSRDINAPSYGSLGARREHLSYSGVSFVILTDVVFRNL
jgi:hypothetical protein